MIRFAVVGNCQAAQVAKCVQYLVPGCEVNSYVVLETSEIKTGLNQIIEKLAACDYVLYQPQHYIEVHKTGTTRGIGSGRVALYPSIEFTAFHPDLVYVLHETTRIPVKSPIGDYHSALAFLCYSIGLDVEQTICRFNEAIFDRLGYLARSLWTASKNSLVDAGHTTGLPVERYLQSWMRRGCFMYSVNHPKLFVLADLAAGALSSCGLTANPKLCEEFVPDELNCGSVWPVYPEIGANLALDGSYVFKAPSPENGKNPYFGLHEFVNGSFATYKSYGLTEMVCPRIEAWKADSNLLRFILGDSVPVPVADAPKSAGALPLSHGTSRDLPCSPGAGLCFLDWVNSVPAIGTHDIKVSSRDKIVFRGWAMDQNAGTLAMGVDVVLDGNPYGAMYGSSRIDVAEARGNAALENSGFQFSIDPGLLGKGVHFFGIRIIVQGGLTYDEGPTGRLVVE